MMRTPWLVAGLLIAAIAVVLAVHSSRNTQAVKQGPEATTASGLSSFKDSTSGPSPSATQSPVAEQSPAATPADQAKLKTLDSILESRNDNDPRLDTDFTHLTPGSKELFKKKFHDLPREKLNERGTIVYLLGKNLQDPSDFAFLRQVIQEPPCLSMADCSKESSASSREDLHQEAGIGTSLAYPALMALKWTERTLELPAAERSQEKTEEAFRTLETGAQSPDPRVASLAQSLLKKFKH